MRGRAGINTIFGVGVLPIPAYGVGVGLGFQWRRFALAVEGRFLGTPNFSVAPDRSAFAVLGLGIVSACYQTPLPRPLYSFEACPFAGAGRLHVQPVVDEDTPGYGVASAHPFTAMGGLRALVGWQISHAKAPDLYLKAFAEFNVGFLRNRISFNNIDVWGTFPPVGVVLGIEFSMVMNQPAKWADPIEAEGAAKEAPSTR